MPDFALRTWPCTRLKSAKSPIRSQLSSGAVSVLVTLIPCYPRGLGFGTVVGSRSPEGRCTWQRDWANAVDVPGPATEALGGSAIISPLGDVLAGPFYNEEGILYADFDLAEVARGKFDFDIVPEFRNPPAHLH